jgi:hypothetical protein
MPFLHISSCEGYALLAVISEEIVMRDGHYDVLDIEVVESRNEARLWYDRQCKLRPWEGLNVRKDSSLHIGNSE